LHPLPRSYKELLDQAVTTYEGNLSHASEYLRGRGIHPDTARAFRLGVVVDPTTGHEPFAGRLAIPSLGPSGPYQIKFRCIRGHDCKEFSHPKYLTDAMDSRLYNVRSIAELGDTICITEGEIDAITLSQLGYKAVAAPGSNTWKRHHSRMFAGFARVFVFGDGDKAGRTFAKEVSDSIRAAVRVALPDEDDLNLIYTRDGAEAIHELFGGNRRA
jgi:DNA primase